MILVTPIILIQIFTTFMFFDRHWNRMADRLAFAVAGEIALVAGRVESDGSIEEQDIEDIIGYAGQYLQLLISYERDGTIEAQDQYGRGIGRRYVIKETLSRALDEQVRRPYVINVDPREKWVELSVQLAQGVLHVSMPERRLFSSSSYIFILWMIGSSTLLLVVAVLFMRNQIRPIRRLSVVAERFGKGQDIPASFKPEGATEVRQAANAFLDMRRRIKRQIEQRTTMLAGVSHDLRTPLTRMKLELAMLDQTPDIIAIQKDIEDMEHMINAYLDFAKNEGDAAHEEPVRTDIAALIAQSISQSIAVAKCADVTVNQDIEAGLSLSVRPLLLKRCLVNLIGNAARHGGRKIDVSAAIQEDYLVINIEDDGPGIPPEKRDEVFRPFYRLEESRNTATGGVGLGLPIALDIVHKHGGRIALDESHYGGLKVQIKLPV
jgi:two-component system osmolarity sensor histidine kinase EnvZ